MHVESVTQWGAGWWGSSPLSLEIVAQGHVRRQRLASNSKVTSFQQGGTPQIRVITTTPWMDLSTSAQPSGCICPHAREPRPRGCIYPPSADPVLRPRGSSWARKGRGLTRRPLATTRRNASAKHSGGIRAFVRFAGRFLANESQPARRATPMPSARNARTRRSHVVAAARISQRCIRTALPRRVGRIPAGFRRPSNGNTKGHESSIR